MKLFSSIWIKLINSLCKAMNDHFVILKWQAMWFLPLTNVNKVKHSLLCSLSDVQQGVSACRQSSYSTSEHNIATDNQCKRKIQILD